MTEAITPGVPGRYWHSLEDGRIQCDVCPRFCKLHEGQRGLCFVRARHDNQIVLTTYGQLSIDGAGAPTGLRLSGTARSGTWELGLPSRSAYVLAGAARTRWQHALSLTKVLRSSTTVRTLKRRPS